MTGLEAIAAVTASGELQGVQAPASPVSSPNAFARLLLDGVDQVDEQVAQAEALAKSFAVDGSIPPHQVTLALEQARLSVELMLQVRTHLVDGYNELLRMQM
jgi:flagellar hook-basal body complex protein FliE